jgi:hypothetical protein
MAANMHYPPHYQTPPPYMAYDYRTPPVSPAPGPQNYSNPYSARYSTATPSPRVSPKVPGHHRSASHSVPQPQPFASTRGAGVPYFTDPRFYATAQRTPQADYVSGGFDYYVRPSRQRRDSDATPLKRSHREKKKHRPSQAQPVHTKVFYDQGYDSVYEVPPPPYERYARHETFGSADRYYYHQVPIYEPAAPKPSSRQRRSSEAKRPEPAQPKRPAAPSKTSRKATEEDARKAEIPAGYCYKNWDPTEEPIMLLGSVFDANSLGKWIYDWTVFRHGSTSPMSGLAGELWLSLIQLAGKVKRAEELMPKIRKQESREMVEDFLESGERLWIRFVKLLNICEDYMWKAAKTESGRDKPKSMGKNSGCEFVDSIFGRDRQLEKTEKLMQGMRLWSMRFDANCEEILRHPSA